MKKRTRLILTLIIGFTAAMVIMSAAIYFGYTQAYRTDVDLLTVRILGIPVYELTKTGAEYVGSSKGIWMGLFCGICMLFAAALGEVLHRARRK